MPLTTTRKMLLDAQAGHYAVGAFNVENMEMAQAIIGAAEELRAPVILQTTPSHRALRRDGPLLRHGGRARPRRLPCRWRCTSSHGDSFELCVRALRDGYTSIMIDGSKLPLKENIALTKRVADMCNAAGVPVEGEIGRVGGKEDDLEVENAGYTIPEEAVQFEKESGLFSMAVGVGTAHGFYKEKPQLIKDLIVTLRGSAHSLPMVLHGASGLSDDRRARLHRRGICKVNFATELRAAYTEGRQGGSARNPECV